MDTKRRLSESLQKEFFNDTGLGIPDFSDRDMAGFILPDLDYEAQLIAIATLLRLNDEMDARTDAEIKEVEDFARKSTGMRNERAVDEWADLLHGSTYQSATRSMAALGMLAPLIESLFYQAFQGIRARFYGLDVIPVGDARSGMSKPDEFWDCHFFYDAKKKKKNTKDLMQGTMQLAAAVNLTPHLPGDLLATLEPLFRYRNKMFHFGFEWPPKECLKFAKQIADEKWAALFSSATQGDVRFIFYMTDELINQSFDLVHQLLNSFGAYCRERSPVVEIPVA